MHLNSVRTCLQLEDLDGDIKLNQRDAVRARKKKERNARGRFTGCLVEWVACRKSAAVLTGQRWGTEP